MFKLTVVIPCFNGARTLATQLDALAGQSCSEPWEVILADNGSTDDSVAIAQRYKGRIPNLRVADASARKGQPFALNTGAEAARGESVAFCDADDEVGAGWVQAMVSALATHEFVAGRIDTRKLNPPGLASRHPQEAGLQKATYPPYLPHAGGGTLGVRRHLHQAVGGFDEALPYLHDTDFCFKLQLRGVPLFFVEDAVVHVRNRTTWRGIVSQARHYAEYRVLIYKRYRTASEPGRWRAYLGGWRELLASTDQIRSDEDRASWLWKLGSQIGRLEGSIKHGVPPV
jgi:glycosyltransferase involved in cell wall biosynthesis